jgi:hypothetical protein
MKDETFVKVCWVFFFVWLALMVCGLVKGDVFFAVVMFGGVEVNLFLAIDVQTKINQRQRTIWVTKTES